MFGTLFLGTVLAVFLTLGAVRGDAERGLLQPLLVRPVSRRDLQLGRYVAAAGVSRGLRRVVFIAGAIVTGRSAGGGPIAWASRARRGCRGRIVAALALAARCSCRPTRTGSRS